MIILSLEESNNFDNYLKELGVGFILRQLAQVVFIVIRSFFLYSFVHFFIFIRLSFIFILARSGRTANSNRGQVVKATDSYHHELFYMFL